MDFIVEGYDAEGYCHINTTEGGASSIQKLYPVVVVILWWYRERLSGLKGGAPVAGIKRLYRVEFVTK